MTDIALVPREQRQRDAGILRLLLQRLDGLRSHPRALRVGGDPVDLNLVLTKTGLELKLGELLLIPSALADHALVAIEWVLRILVINIVDELLFLIGLLLSLSWG